MNAWAQPADDWARQGEQQRPSILSTVLAGCVLALLIAGGIAFALWRGEGDTSLLLGALLVVLGLTVAALVMVMRQVDQFLLHPMSQMYAWALRMCEGDFEARIAPGQTGQFANLSFHINRLSEALDRLANEMDDMVDSQTRRLQDKNESLETLYEVTAALSGAHSLEEALQVSASRLARTLRAEGATVDFADFPPASLAAANALCLNEPLIFDGERLGTLQVQMPADSAGAGEEQRKLIDGVARHLAMAIARARLAEQGLNLSLMRERTTLAHELHDSLAQTLASLQMRMRLLESAIPEPRPAEVRDELRRIDEVLDQANTELRELIAHFRAPIDERGLEPALQSLIARCRRNQRTSYFLQVDEPVLPVPAASVVQVLRIVREALINVEKHSQANTARVLVDTSSDGRCRVLVEDDGVGMGLSQPANRDGNHIGLSVMRDRALVLGGELTIESEPGDGVRITLDFDPTHAIDLPVHAAGAS